MKKSVLIMSVITLLFGATAVFAAVSGAGWVAKTTASNLADIARLITGAAYVGGMAFAIGAIVKFKAHKDNPTQIPIGTPIALLFVGAALIFMPTVFKSAGVTMFQQSGTVAESSGISVFGANRGGSR